jgi:metal-responsive CopG/Arc/MetJ family transcriptional regulator
MEMAVKRINMDLDNDLWKSVKKVAIDQDVELREWVTQALREKLSRDVDGEEKTISTRI